EAAEDGAAAFGAEVESQEVLGGDHAVMVHTLAAGGLVTIAKHRDGSPAGWPGGQGCHPGSCPVVQSGRCGTGRFCQGCSRVALGIRSWQRLPIQMMSRGEHP